jgi:hypothetical protein
VNEAFGVRVFVIDKSLYSDNVLLLGDCFEFCIDLDEVCLIRSLLIDPGVSSIFPSLCLLFIAFVDEDEIGIVFFKTSVCSEPRNA